MLAASKSPIWEKREIKKEEKKKKKEEKRKGEKKNQKIGSSEKEEKKKEEKKREKDLIGQDHSILGRHNRWAKTNDRGNLSEKKRRMEISEEKKNGAGGKREKETKQDYFDANHKKANIRERRKKQQ